MEEVTFSIESVSGADLLVAAVLFAWVGTLNYFRKNKPDNQVLELLAELLSSGFSGAMVFFICEWQEIRPPAQYVLSGFGAYLGPRTLFTMVNHFFPQWIGGKKELDEP